MPFWKRQSNTDGTDFVGGNDGASGAQNGDPTTNTSSRTAGGTQTLFKRPNGSDDRRKHRKSSPNKRLLPQQNNPNSTFQQAAAQDRYPTTDLASQDQRQKILPDLPRGGLWAWIPHMAQSADDSTIVDRVQDVFFYAEHIVDNYYTQKPYDGGNRITDLDPVYRSSHLSTSRLDSLLQETTHQIPLIKHVLIALILRLISFESGPGRKSLLPEVFKNYAAISQVGMKSVEGGIEIIHLQPALSAHRVLSAYICSDIENDSNYIQQRSKLITQASTDFDKAFRYWTKPETNSEDRLSVLRKLLEKASSMGILLFAQPSVFRFDWGIATDDQSTQQLPIWPRLLRTFDEEAQPRGAGDCMIDTKCGISFDRLGDQPDRSIYPDTIASSDEVSSSRRPFPPERAISPVRTTETRNRISIQSRPKPSPRKPIATEITQPATQDLMAEPAPAPMRLPISEAHHRHTTNDTDIANNSNFTENTINHHDIRGEIPSRPPALSTGTGAPDLSSHYQRLNIRSDNLVEPPTEVLLRNNISYSDPALDRRRPNEIQEPYQYQASGHDREYYGRRRRQSLDQESTRERFMPHATEHIASTVDYFEDSNFDVTGDPPPYESEARSDMNVRTQQPNAVSGSDFNRSHSRQPISTIHPHSQAQHTQDQSTNLNLNRVRRDQPSSPSTQPTYLRMPEPHLGPFRTAPPHPQMQSSPTGVSRRPVPGKRTSGPAYPPTSSNRHLINLNADIDRRNTADDVDDQRQSRPRSSRRRSNSLPTESPSSGRSRSGSRSSFSRMLFGR